MPLVQRNDPYAGYNFEITITGISDDGKAVKGSFAEVSGLEVEVTPIDYRAGSEETRYRKVPGLQKFGNITLKRGVTADLDFWNWILLAMRGQVNRTDGAIALHDESHKEVMRWQFTRGWPCKYTGPGLNAKNNEIAIEMLEICHEGLSIEGQAS
jgi:phage tail-like protein